MTRNRIETVEKEVPYQKPIEEIKKPEKKKKLNEDDPDEPEPEPEPEPEVDPGKLTISYFNYPFRSKTCI